MIHSVPLPVNQSEMEERVELWHGDLPGVFITARAFHRLKLLLRLCPAEIAGLGSVTRHPQGFLVQDVFVLPQLVTDSEAELDQEALFGFLSNFVGDGGDPSSIQLWWHSHGDGDVYWSDTDLDTIERFSGLRVISVVGNRQGELLCRLDLFAPRRERFEGLPLLEEAGAEAALDLESLRQEVMTEIKAKVRMRLPMPSLIDHEGVVGLISDPGYEVAVEPGEGGRIPPTDFPEVTTGSR